MKIGYSASTGKVTVSIDEKNSGNFHTCFTENINLKPDWWRRAYIGISATTGQLADNHDILSVETVEGESDPDKIVVDKTMKAAEEEKQMKQDLESRLIQFGISKNTLTENEKNLLRILTKLEEQEKDDLGKLSRELEHTLVGMNLNLNLNI